MTAPSAPGALRRLQRLQTDDHRFHVVALDHRDSLRSAFSSADIEADDDELKRFKRDVLAASAPFVSGAMLDPELSWPMFATGGAVPRDVGVICALEDQGYDADSTDGNRWLPGWDPARIARSGADAAKLLVLYRPDDSPLARAQERLVRLTVDACADLDLPVFVEPVPVDVDLADRGEAIVRTAERFAAYGPMVIKLPWPGDRACALVTEACAGTPWALLSWGIGFDAFASQLARAVAAGCDGFMVGRAIWREAIDPRHRATVLGDMIPDRLRRLVEIDAAERGRREPARQPGG